MVLLTGDWCVNNQAQVLLLYRKVFSMSNTELWFAGLGERNATDAPTIVHVSPISH